jgi:hypothetical protein
MGCDVFIYKSSFFQALGAFRLSRPIEHTHLASHPTFTTDLAEYEISPQGLDLRHVFLKELHKLIGDH